MLFIHKVVDNKVVKCEDSNEGTIFVYKKPNSDEIKSIIEKYKLDEHDINSALDPDELGRLEFEEDHTVIILKRPNNYCTTDNLLFKVTSIGIFLFNSKLVIIMPEDIQIFEGRQHFKLNSMIDVVLKLIYGTISHFLGHLKVINMMSDSLEQKINSSMENKYLLNMFTLEKSLVYYLNGINSNSMLFEKIKANSTKIGFTESNLEIFNDIIIENNQCYKLADIYTNILSSMTGARAAIVGNNLNVLMKTLNIITISIMIPTFVVSIFSMNVGIPLQDRGYAFWLVMGLSLLSVILTSIFWKLKKW